MNRVYKEILQRNHVYLLECLQAKETANHLFNDRVFERNDLDRVDVERTPHDQSEVLLQILPYKSGNAFEIFIDIQCKLGLTNIAEKLRKSENNVFQGMIYLC